MAGSKSSGLRHSLGFAPELWRMCIVNKTPFQRAAKSLRLEPEQVKGSLRLLRSCESLPSPERLAVTVMLDPGLDDQDIAEIFGRSVRWASVVRAQREEIRQEEFIDHRLEFLEDGLQPGMPTPQAIRSTVFPTFDKKGRLPPKNMPVHYGGKIRTYSWDGVRFAGIQNFAG